MFVTRKLHAKQIVLFDVDMSDERQMFVSGLVNLRYGFYHFPHQFTVTTPMHYINTEIIRTSINSIPERDMVVALHGVDRSDPMYNFLIYMRNRHETECGLINICDPDIDILGEFGWPRHWMSNPDGVQEYNVVDAINEHRRRNPRTENN